MAGEVVDDGQRCAVEPVESEDADFRVDRTDGSDLFIRRD